LDAFTAQGIIDIWFSFSTNSLPDLLRPSSKVEFLRLQSTILTKSFNLEKGEKGQHRYFVDGKVLPFKILGHLEEGVYGTIDKVINILNCKVYARKRIYRDRFFQQARQSIRGFKTELRILKKVTHIYIVELIGSYIDARYVTLIMSLVADGDLADFLA
jgi:serine/threonine protein kinase